MSTVYKGRHVGRCSVWNLTLTDSNLALHVVLSSVPTYERQDRGDNLLYSVVSDIFHLDHTLRQNTDGMLGI